MIKNLKKNKVLIFIAISFLPVLFTALWLFKNTQLPASDAASYLLTALRNYRHFEHRGFWSLAYSCYIHRGWRPIFFPVFLSPYLILSSGNVLVGMGLLAVSCVLATVIYVYLFFRLILDRVSAIVATNFIGLLPLIQAQILGFFSESVLFPCVIGGLYHLIQSNYFRHRKHSIGFIICLTLAIIIRPIEAVTVLMFVLSGYFFLGWSKGFFSVKQIMIIIALADAALSVFFGACLLYPSAFTDTNMAALLRILFMGTMGSTLFFCLVAKWIPVKKSTNSNKNDIVFCFLSIFLLAVIWFLPYASETAEWIYRTSVGDVAIATIQQKSSVFSKLLLQINAEGAVVVVGIMLLAIYGGVLTFRRKISVFFSLPIIYLLLVIPFPIVEILLTVQNTPRKLSIAFPALLMAMVIIGLQKGRLWMLRISLAVLLLMLHFSLLIVGTLGNKPLVPFLKNMMGFSIPRPVTLYPNPHDVVEQFLTIQAKKYNLKSIMIAVDPDRGEPIDPFLLSAMVYGLKCSYNVPYAYFGTYSTDNILKLSQDTNIGGLFLSDNISNMTVSRSAVLAYSEKYKNEKNPSVKTWYELLLFYSRNKLQDIGWKLGPCLILKSACSAESEKNLNKQADFLGCLLLKDKKQENKKIRK